MFFNTGFVEITGANGTDSGAGLEVENFCTQFTRIVRCHIIVNVMTYQQCSLISVFDFIFLSFGKIFKPDFNYVFHKPQCCFRVVRHGGTTLNLDSTSRVMKVNDNTTNTVLVGHEGEAKEDCSLST